MYKLRFLLSIAATLFFSLALCSTTQAAARTYVSVTGADSNPCTYASPCRLFQHAHDVVADGGEVIALTSGAYGTLTITKNVTISGVGVSAVASPNSTEDAITIATAGITVVLRSISIRAFGAGTGGNGINVTSVRDLHIEGCVISGFIRTGILVDLSTGSHIFIKDTIVRNNGIGGIFITTSTGTVRASIDNCRLERNFDDGFFASNNSRVTINRSVASGNGGGGFYAFSDASGATTALSCEECVSSNNSNGFIVQAYSGGAATIRVSHSVATNNSNNGFLQAVAGVFKSLVNNLVDGNGTDTSGTITVLAAQ